MSTIIKKLNLPCDIKYVINSFLYNDLGYTHEEVFAIEKYRQNGHFQMQRITLELWKWKDMNASVQFLRGSNNGISYRGVFKNIIDEQSVAIDAVNRNIFPEKYHDKIMKKYNQLVNDNKDILL